MQDINTVIIIYYLFTFISFILMFIILNYQMIRGDLKTSFLLVLYNASIWWLYNGFLFALFYIFQENGEY